MNQTQSPADLMKTAVLGRFLSYLCLAGVALSIVAIYSDWLQLRLLDTTPAADLKYSLEASKNDSRQETIASIQLAVSMSTMVLLLMWFYQSYRNLPLLGARGQRFKPGWAAGAFVVPILNFFRPLQIARELWQGSDPACSDPQAWKHRPVPLLLPLWWAAWLLVNLQGAFLVLELMQPGAGESLAQLKKVTVLTMVNEGLDALSMFMTFLLADRLGKQQNSKAAQVLAGLARQADRSGDQT